MRIVARGSRLKFLYLSLSFVVETLRRSPSQLNQFGPAFIPFAAAFQVAPRVVLHFQKQLLVAGASNLLPIATILLFSLALGDVASLLGTGPYVASVAGPNIPAFMLAPLLFLLSAFIAFSVGSSWGTFAIMIPIAIPVAMTLGLPVPLLLGAAISGAIFGDHASPISDTTVVASMASACDHIDHVRTQLPYALLAAAIATVGFLILGLMG